MNYLQELTRKMRQIERGQEKARKEKARYGVFVWRGDGRYLQETPLKIFKSEKLAQKHADKLNEECAAYVVRQIS